MALLIVGLVLFLGAHSIRVFADGWRSRTIARIGEKRWKGVYSIVSIAGLVLLVWGFIHARGAMQLWIPVAPLRHVTAALMLPVFVMFVAARVPGNAIRAWLHHPQVLSVALWAFAHLLSNGGLADVILFGSFLGWAILAFVAARKRDHAAAAVYAPGTARGTIVCIVVGLAIYAAFVAGLHRWLFGVPPF